MFDFYDFDRDGSIGSIDILNLIESLNDRENELYKEVRLVTEFFMAEVITRKIGKRPPDFMNIEVYQHFMGSREVLEAFGGGLMQCPLIEYLKQMLVEGSH